MLAASARGAASIAAAINRSIASDAWMRDLRDLMRYVTGMADRKASDVFVECLEAEDVRYVFGIPGEETLDLSESLADSSIEFVPVRHEQGGAYMADVYGRLTGRAGVCLG